MNLYIALTPYHVLLTLLHENRCPGDKVILVDLSGAFFAHFKPALKQNDFGLEWTVLDESSISTPLKALAFGRLKWGWLQPEIAGFMKNNSTRKFDDIYVFNDKPILIQYILHSLTAKRVVYIEDGAAAYNNHQFSANKAVRIAKSLIFGDVYSWIPVLGTSRYIDAGMYSRKHLIRAANRQRPALDYVTVSDRYAIMDELASALGMLPATSSESDSALVLLPPTLPDPFSVWAGEQLRLAVRHLRANGWDVYLKFHPLWAANRDSPDFRGCHIVDQHLPAELIPVRLANLRLLLGTATTSIPAIQFLHQEKNLEVYALMNRSMGADETLLKFYEAIGVITCKDFTGFAERVAATDDRTPGISHKPESN